MELPGGAADNAAGSFSQAVAPWAHVAIVPAPTWTDVATPDRQLASKEGDHLTYLVWERQVHLPTETSFHCTSVRLETSVAVQHQSQWRMNLDPRFQKLQLHWLRVVRGGEAIDHLRRERMRLIQRETQLDHLVIDGQWTLLVVLDDVRVGDIVEAGYSFVGAHPVRPGGSETFFVVPPALVVGHYRLRVEFDASRIGLNCLTSPDAPARVDERLPNGHVRWTWQGQQIRLREPEPNQPSSFLDYVWVQVSDLADWQPLASRLAEAWTQGQDEQPPSPVPDFARPAVVDEAAIHQLIRRIQEEIRYLSVDLDSGGWIPAPPAIVAQRRYGDCKDLAWLATQVLRDWGVAARPILVGTGLRERVLTLQPMAVLFNHAILEVEFAGETRWFDLTLRHQGGDFRTQPIPWYACGLPVAPGATLRKQPGRPAPGLYAVRETIDLDTRRGEATMVEVRLRAEAWNADHLRRSRATQGVEEFAKERLGLVRRRYGKAERVGQLQWRDDRARNICELAETFEIRDAWNTDESGQRALFDVPPNILIETFYLPEEKPRRGPWDLPHPIEVRHEIRVRGRSFRAGSRQRRRWVCPEFTATLDEPRDTDVWKKIMRLTVTADVVPVERVDEYRRILDRFLQATTWRLFLPSRESRLATEPGFGALPPLADGIDAYVPPADLAAFADVTNVPLASSTGAATRPSSGFGSWRPPENSWRFALPLLIFAAMAARTCTSMVDTPSYHNNSFIPPPSPPVQSGQLDFPALAKDDEPLPPSPAIHGAVYSHTSEVDQPAVPTVRVPPTYPPAMRLAGIEGEATIDFVVTEEGVPARITVVTQSHASFGQFASVAISKWRFRPATKDGHPVNMTLRQPITFHLDPGFATKLFPNERPLEDLNQIPPLLSSAPQRTE